MPAPQRIVMVVGILDREDSRLRIRMMDYFKAAYARHWPSATFEVVPCFFWPWQKTRIAAYAQALQTKYADTTPTLFVGYSLGGVIASHVAGILPNAVGVATFCAPHRLARVWGLQDTFTGPQVHTMGVTDIWVPCILGHKGYRFVRGGHWLDYILGPKPARTLARLTYQQIP